MFTAFVCTQNFSAKAMIEMGYGSLGYASQASLFFTWSIFSLFTGPIIKKLKPKYVFILCACLRMIWEASFLLPSTRYERLKAGETDADITEFYLQKDFIKVMMIICGGTSGLGSAITWVGFGAYVS